MLQLINNLQAHDDENLSYVFETEKYMPNEYLHGKADKDGYKICYYGSRHLVVFPSVTTFDMQCDVEFNEGFLGEVNSDCGFVFGYDRTISKRHEIFVRFRPHGGVVIELYLIDCAEKTVLKKQEYEFDRETQDKFAAHLRVSENKVLFTFGAFEFEAEIEAMKGRIGVYRGEGYSTLCFSNLQLSTEEAVAEETLMDKVTLAIPDDNGAAKPYFIDVAAKKVGDVYKVEYTLWGGYSLNEIKDSYSDDTWTFPRDDIDSPFLRLGQGKRLYIESNGIRHLDDHYPNKPLHEMTRASYEKNYNVRELPLSGEFYFNTLPDFSTLSYGYKNFMSAYTQHYCGGNEFVYSKQGKLLRRGGYLDADYIVDVRSPMCQEIYEKLPKDVPMYEKAVEHLKGNHYFTVHENPEFTVEVLTKKPLDLLCVNVYLKDAFQKEIIGEFTVCESKAAGLDGYNAEAWSLKTDKLPIGVYHAVIEICYAGKVEKTHVSAFEVLDMDKDICPPEASGLPSIYSGDGGPNDTLYFCPEYVNTAPDCNVTHYYSMGLYGSHAAQNRQVWKLLHLYKRKLMLWATGRTMTRQETVDPKTLEWDIFREADIINLTMPGIEFTRNYYRPDHYNPYNYVKGTVFHDWVEEFLSENPAYAEMLGFSKMPDEDVDEEHMLLMSKLHGPWLEYATRRYKNLMMEQWKKIKAINPKAKRHSYGHIPTYTTPLVAAHSAKWFGFITKEHNEVVDAFIQLEDYPFNCAYTTTRGAFQIMTTKYLCPKLCIDPELYVDFEAGCPDGMVDSGRPPFGIYYAPPYVQTTQLSEMFFNAGWFKDGEYCYSRDHVANIFDFAMSDSKARHEALIKGWGGMKKNAAKKPYKATAFVYDMNEKEDRVDVQLERALFCKYDLRNFYNISESGEMHLYRIMRERGHGMGFATGFAELKHFTKDDLNLLVLPSLEDVSDETIAEIMRLHESGVPLFAVGNVGKLAPLFGVKEHNRTQRVSYIDNGKTKEQILVYDAEIRYDNVDAEVVLSTDDNTPILLKKGNTCILNCSLCQVGVDDFRRMAYMSRNNISKHIYNALDDCLTQLFTPQVSVDANVGTSLYETLDGRRNLLLVDYTDMEKDLIQGYKTRVTVRLNDLDCNDVEDLRLNEMDADMTVVKKNGKVVAFSATILPKQALMFTLK